MRSSSRRVLILGAGYGGLRVALDLANAVERGARIRATLVDRDRHHTLITHLHRVATAGMPREAGRLPLSLLLRDKPVELLQASVKRIVPATSEVITSDGSIGYDFLVVALGSRANFRGIAGLESNAITIRPWAAAVQTRERIIAACRGRSCHILIGGGGYTGVELAGELADWLPALTRDGWSTSILEVSSRLLPGYDIRLADRVAAALRRKGVRIHLRRGIASADAESVALTTGEVIRYDVLIWAGGIRGPDLLRDTGLPLTPSARVKVDGYLRARGHPNIYVIGDTAAVVDPTTGHPLPPSGQLAIQEGETVAKTLVAIVRGEAPSQFAPHLLGEIVTVGRHQAIASIGPLLINGRAASAMKEYALQRYVHSLGGVGVLRELDRRREVSAGAPG